MFLEINEIIYFEKNKVIKNGNQITNLPETIKFAINNA